jgi:hypothetical protein
VLGAASSDRKLQNTNLKYPISEISQMVSILKNQITFFIDKKSVNNCEIPISFTLTLFYQPLFREVYHKLQKEATDKELSMTNFLQNSKNKDLER